MKEMVFSFLPLEHSIVLSIVVHTANAPSEDEWAEYMAAVRANEKELSRVRTLVFTDGGSPSAAQRKSINDFLKGRQTRVVLVSSSSLVRGITTALSWFNPLVNSVAPTNLTEAFRYLEVQPKDEKRVWDAIIKLKTALGRPDLKSIITQQRMRV